MPRIKLSKSAIDALPTLATDVVYWDVGWPGFGVKVTPKGRKVFIVLYRTAGAGSALRKYTIGPYGRVEQPAQLSSDFSSAETAVAAAREYIQKLNLPPGAASWRIVDAQGREISYR